MTDTPASASAPAGRVPAGAVAVAAVAVAFAVAYSLALWPEWRSNPDLSHGLFAPLVFGLLVWESRRQGTPRWLPPRPWRLPLIAVAVTGALLLVCVSGLLAASVGWSHALVRFVLGATLAACLFAGLLVLATEEARAVPLNWTSLSAVFLWVLVAPLPHGTYARLTLSLQTGVTEAVLHALHLLGVPARQHGNIIELASTSVGVEEACSGIRSLLSCVYAGFFFAAWLVRRPARRAVLIVLAPLMAVAMNFLRSLALTLMADRGVDIAGFWHDATGFAILGITAAALAWLASALGPKTAAPPAAPAAPGTPPRAAAVVFWSGHAAIAALAVFFWVHARPAPDAGRAAPDLRRLLPAAVDGWEVYTAEDLYRFADVLRTDNLVERTYVTRRGGEVVQLTVYVAYWRAGQAPVSLVASHTPDACWPGAGWSPRGTTGQADLSVGDRRLPPAEQRVFVNDAAFTQHVWFWHVYDGRVISYRDPYSVPALLQIALQYGFRREGDQLFIRLSSNQPWDVLGREPFVRQLLANLAQTGL